MRLTAAEAEAFVERFAEAWRAPTADGHAALFADDVVLVQPLMGRVEGKEQCREAFARLFRLVPDIHAVVHRWSANDEVLFIEFTLKGTFGGKELAWSAVDRFVARGRADQGADRVLRLGAGGARDGGQPARLARACCERGSSPRCSATRSRAREGRRARVSADDRGRRPGRRRTPSAIGYDGWWAVETQARPVPRRAPSPPSAPSGSRSARDRGRLRAQPDDRRACRPTTSRRCRAGASCSASARRSSRTSPSASRCRGRKPAARMREFVLAVRAIWEALGDRRQARLPRRLLHAHADDAVLRSRARTRTATRRSCSPRVGPLMTEAAGEVADGMFCHGFSTERYVREVTLPGAASAGAAKAGKSARAASRSSRPAFVVARRHRGGARRRHATFVRSRSASTGRRPPTGRCSSCTAGASCRTSSTR